MKHVLISLFAVLLCTRCDKYRYQHTDCSKMNVSYQEDISPLITANCSAVGCHANSSANGDFSTYIGLKGKANNGSLKKRVCERKDMPVSAPLSFKDRRKLFCWIESGAPQN